MRVWVTREEEDDGPLCTALRERGLVPVLEPVFERAILSDLDDELRQLSREDWLVLTSVFAIEHIAVEPARVPRVAVVGQPSRKVASSRGLRVQLVGPGPGSEKLFKQVLPLARNHKLLYPRSSLAKVPWVPPDVDLRAPVMYETRPRSYNRNRLKKIDVIAVASPSAAKAVGGKDRPIASIGPTTSSALREMDVEPWVEAKSPTFEALAQAIAERWEAEE